MRIKGDFLKKLRLNYFAYRAAAKAMEQRISGIATMSEVYVVIYIIDLVKNELIPVVASAEAEKLRPKHLSGSEQLNKLFETDSEGAYQELALKLCSFDTIKTRLAEKNTYAFEYLGKFFGWSRIRFIAMDREEGKPVEKVLFTIQDINDEKAEMDAAYDLIAEAEHESKAKSTFLANMSHEIRTPINTIIGFDTMILRESKNPVVKSYAKSINSAANMLLSLINGVLDVSKMEADKMELVNGDYSFKQMLSEVVNMVKARAEFEKLEFICDVSPNICDRLNGDSVRLKQVIINLITNAAKYTDEGSVKLSVFGNKHEGKMHLLISVKDTGIGIREEDLEKLAQRFQRFDDERNHSVEGTGIGLNLVKGILDLMDSQLHVISVYGEGSEFYFEIEQDIVDEETIGKIDFSEIVDEDEEYQALFTAPDAKVLVVDDNAMNLKVFTDLLIETEVQIDTASSGARALEMTSEKKYDVIFMDHMMPQMDGIETFNHIRENKTGINVDTPVIILTANAIKGAKKEYEALGFDAFLSKPIQPELLEQSVMKFVDPSKINTNTTVKKKEETETTLPTIFGVDTGYGLNHTGSMASYVALLKQFCLVAQNDLEELEKYEEQIKKDAGNKEAMNSYRIKVHAMKASANVMGALQVYGLAATLEELASKNDFNGIGTLAPYFNEAWSNLRSSVKAAFEDETERKSLPDMDTLEALLHQLETSIKAYDIKTSDDLTNKLKEFDWPDDKEKLIEQLVIEVANLDADKVVEICEKLR